MSVVVVVVVVVVIVVVDILLFILCLGTDVVLMVGHQQKVLRA